MIVFGLKDFQDLTLSLQETVMSILIFRKFKFFEILLTKQFIKLVWKQSAKNSMMKVTVSQSPIKDIKQKELWSHPEL